MAPSDRRKKASSSTSEEAYAGPSQETPPTSPEAASAGSTRMKRFLGRNVLAPSSENELGLTDEDYRCIGPLNLHVPVYTVSTTVSDELQNAWSSGLEAFVISVLRGQGIDIKYVELVKLGSDYSGRTSGRASGDFINVRARKHNILDNSWLLAGEEILQYCTRQRLNNINVQIADDRGLIARISRTVHPNEPIVVVWNELVPAIMDQLKPRRQWLTIDLVSRGRPKLSNIDWTSGDNFRPTVLVMVSRDNDEDWCTAADALFNLLDQRNFRNVAVEIIRGELCRSALRKVSSTEILAHHENICQTKAYLGASIQRDMAEDHLHGTGTLGCFVVLRFSNGMKRILGLTNFHVIMAPYQLDDHEPIKGQDSKVKAWISTGINPADPECIQMRLNMPSRKDYNEYLAHLQEEIDSFKQRPEGLKYEQVEQSLDNMSLEEIGEIFGQKHVKIYQKSKPWLDAQIEMLEQGRARYCGGNENLGHVFAASGLRITDTSMALDWALIEVLPSRTPSENEVNLGKYTTI
jgi:hypothetical protein